MEGAIDDLFAGVKLNATEGRAVLHMALRADQGDVFTVDGEDVVEGVLTGSPAMLRFVDSVHEFRAKVQSLMWSTLALEALIWGLPWRSKRCGDTPKGPSVTSSAMSMARTSEAVLSTLNLRPPCSWW